MREGARVIAPLLAFGEDSDRARVLGSPPTRAVVHGNRPVDEPRDLPHRWGGGVVWPADLGSGEKRGVAGGRGPWIHGVCESVIPSGARCAGTSDCADSCRAPEESSRGRGEARRPPPRLGRESLRRAACAHRGSAMRPASPRGGGPYCRAGFYGGSARFAARDRGGRAGRRGAGLSAGRARFLGSPAGDGVADATAHRAPLGMTDRRVWSGFQGSAIRGGALAADPPAVSYPAVPCNLSPVPFFSYSFEKRAGAGALPRAGTPRRKCSSRRRRRAQARSLCAAPISTRNIRSRPVR